MPTIRVFLECNTPTNRPSGLYDTLIAVSDDAYARGEHLRIASRRATIVGYGGPHRVREVRRVDAVSIPAHDMPAELRDVSPDERVQHRAARLALLMAAAEAETATALPESDPALRNLVQRS